MAMAWVCSIGLVVALVASPAHADSAQHVRASLRVEPEAVLVEQPFELVLDLWVEEGAVGSHLVQLSAARLDVPVDLRVPWFDGQADVVLLPNAPMLPESVAVGVNGARGQLTPLGPVDLAGQRHRHYELRRRFTATRSQELRFDAEVRYASTTGFEPQLFGDPVPRDRTAHSVAVEPLQLTVQPWPETGRPVDFAGAVGRFELAAGLLAEADANGVLSLWLEVRGAGNLARMEAPLIAPPGFHVLGWLEPPAQEPAHNLRRFHYDLSPLDDAPNRIAGLELAYLDPGPPPTYRRASAPPIAVRAGPLAPARPPTGDPQDPATTSPPLGLAAALGVLLGLTAFWLWRRRKLRPRAHAARP